MKNFVKFKAMLRIAGIIALVAVIGFSMIACSSGGGGGSPSVKKDTRDPVTYTGTADGETYTLQIEDGGARAALTPAKGDKYTLTSGEKISKGIVNSFTVTTVIVLILALEDGGTLNATVSNEGLSKLEGTIKWDNGTTTTISITLTPSGSNSSGTFPPPSGTNTEVKSITIEGIIGTGAPTGDVFVFISRSRDREEEVAGGSGTISDGSVTVDLLDSSNEKAFTGVGYYFVHIQANDDKYCTKGEIRIYAANIIITWPEFEEMK